MQLLRDKIKHICLKGMHVFAWAKPAALTCRGIALAKPEAFRRRVAQEKVCACLCGLAAAKPEVSGEDGSCG